MSSASHATSGHRSLGGLFARILFILVLWAGLVYGMLHFVGNVIPRAYQISLATHEAAEEAAKEAANPAPPTTPAAASASAVAAKATPAAAASAPAKNTASSAATTPAVAAASASASAPATASAPASSSAPKTPATTKIPHDPLLAGFNRTALTNVARFYSIVISVFCIGVIILQIFKYKHVEEETAH